MIDIFDSNNTCGNAKKYVGFYQSSHFSIFEIFVKPVKWLKNLFMADVSDTNSNNIFKHNENKKYTDFYEILYF